MESYTEVQQSKCFFSTKYDFITSFLFIERNDETSPDIYQDKLSTKDNRCNKPTS